MVVGIRDSAIVPSSTGGGEVVKLVEVVNVVTVVGLVKVVLGIGGRDLNQVRSATRRLRIWFVIRIRPQIFFVRKESVK